MAITRAGLMRISAEEETKTWRPHPLVLSGAPTKRWHLIELASSLTHNRGIMTVSTVLTNDDTGSERRKNMERNIREHLNKRGIQCLVRVTTAPDAFEGAERLVESYGLGSLVPNTVILGDSENAEYRQKFCDMIAHFHSQQRNVMVVHENEEKEYGERKRIDIWWGGLKGNGGLMIILGYLLQSSRNWYDAEVRIKMVVDDEQAEEEVRENLARIVNKIRTGAKPEVIVANDKSFNEILHESSANADLVLLGMAEPDEEKDFTAYYERLQQRLSGLPTTIMVLAAEEISFGEVLMQQDSFTE